MYEIDQRIAEITSEISKCKGLSSAASNLSDSLKRIGDKFNSCASSLSSGGFTIDKVGIDVYSFGGYKEYVTRNISPIIENLDSLCSQISRVLIRYDNDLTDLKNRRKKLLREQQEEEEREKAKKSGKAPRMQSSM